MKKVEIYDQYNAVYSVSGSDQLQTVNLMPGEALKPTLTLVHPNSGFVTVEGTNLTDEEAQNLVISLYEYSKTIGSSYSDKIINLENSYAELQIEFADGKKLNRVIYTVPENN